MESQGCQAGAKPSRRELEFDGILVGLDGTIIDSTETVVKHWQDVSKEIGVDTLTILETSHGRRSLDTLQLLAPERATWQSAIPVNHGHLAKTIPGAASFLQSLASSSVPWAIVTSSTEPLATDWLTRFSLPAPGPGRLITAESVKVGKPDPACYFLGRDSIQMGGGKPRLLVVEDSPAGIRAGKEAGFTVVGLVTSHTYEEIAAAKPDLVIKDLESISVLGTNRGTAIVQFQDVV